MECVFCKIGRGELASEKIYEDSSTLAFLDINPISPGHTVVIPKEHSENVIEAGFPSVEDLFATVKIATEMIQKSLTPVGFNIGINHGKKAGQAIDHLHVHIIPRFENDGGGSIHSIVHNPPKEQTLEELGGLIRSVAPPSKPTTAEQKPVPKAEEKPKEAINNPEPEVEEHHKRSWQKFRRP